MAVFATVQSGFTVSSGFTLDRPERSFVVAIPSSNGGVVTIQFSLTDPTQSAVASGAFYTLLRNDGSGGTYLVGSGALPAISAPIQPPTPWLRLACGAAQTLTNTYTIMPIFTA